MISTLELNIMVSRLDSTIILLLPIHSNSSFTIRILINAEALIGVAETFTQARLNDWTFSLSMVTLRLK